MAPPNVRETSRKKTSSTKGSASNSDPSPGPIVSTEIKSTVMSHVAKGSAPNYSPASWHIVPTEVKISIMSHVFKGRPPFAALATVSQEWRDLVEPYTFSRITLTRFRLLDFGRMTRRSRSHVRHLWLSLELQPYVCRLCNARNDGEQYFEEDEFSSSPSDIKAIQNALETLFRVLSSWPPRGKLVLDISAYSETDRQHEFKYLTFEPDWKGDDPAWHCRGRRLIQGASRHDWLTPCQRFIPTFHGLHKVFSRIHERWSSELLWAKRLLKAPAVTTLMIRQQNRRQWNPEILLCLISNCPRLEEFYYEPWREWHNDVQESTYRSQDLFFLCLSTLRKLVIFENFSKTYAFTQWCDISKMRWSRQWDPLAIASLSLEEFSVSFLRDAQNFFANLGRFWYWSRLTRFAMTSKLLAEGVSPDDIHQMLISAATAAKRMPSLRVMEIWNGGICHAMVFRYESSPDRRSITILCRGTWRLQLSSAVKHMWHTVARQDHWTPEVTFRQEVIDPGPISSHAAAISALKLVNQVIRPISLQQIHLENLQRRKILQGNHWQYYYAILGPLIAARRAVIAESLPAASTEPPAAGSGTATPTSRRSSKRKRRHSD